MTLEQWREIEHVLEAALDLPEDERSRYLEQACEGRPAVRAEVESLLVAHEEAGDFIETAIASEALREDPSEAPAIGRRIGPYKLVKEIGRGGMGTVYRAERDDGQFAKDVAIKLIGGGAASTASLGRFREERQILATLEHPNIARLLDAGVTEDGLPYIVMEYVEGVPIDEYCERKSVKLEDRLKLFQAICSAVHFAHQHLVVHRDIKPGNLLVTAEGVPKLLDFGIAKILDPAADSPLTLATRTLAPAMTADYASPEQLRGGTITTASDVYSLGVLLYELLAGARPYRLTGKTLGETLHIVCEQDPERPSVAATRPELSGDLDAIVLKALRKEPSQRYASAEEFSNDVGRHLSHWPVLARRGSHRYVARKFLSRHKFAAGIAAVAAVLTLAGMIGILLESRVARVERARAQRRFDDVRKLAGFVIFGIYDGIENLPGSTPVRKLLVTKAQEYLDSLAKEAGGDPSLQLELAAAYVRVGDVQGAPFQANLGDTAGALTSYEKARSTLQTVLAGNPDLMSGRIQLARLYRKFSAIHHYVRNYPLAMEEAKEALSRWESIGERSHHDKESRYGIATAHFDIANLTTGRERQIPAFLKTLEMHQALLADSPEDASNQRNLALDHKRLCGLFEDRDLTKAAAHCQLAVDLDTKRAAANPADSEAKADLGYSLSQSATIYEKKNDLAMASKSFSRSLAIREALVESDPKNVRVRISLVFPHLALGAVLELMGRRSEAMSHDRTAVELGEALLASDPANGTLRGWVAKAYMQRGNLETKLARAAAVSSPQRLDRHRAACSDYGRALERYRENERRGGVSEDERQDAQNAAKETQACAKQ